MVVVVVVSGGSSSSSSMLVVVDATVVVAVVVVNFDFGVSEWGGPWPIIFGGGVHPLGASICLTLLLNDCS